MPAGRGPSKFGRFAGRDRRRRGQGKAETFAFLGFTHTCAKTRTGAFTVLRQTIPQRMRAKLASVNEELLRRRHHPVWETGAYLRARWLNRLAQEGRDGACELDQLLPHEAVAMASVVLPAVLVAGRPPVGKPGASLQRSKAIRGAHGTPPTPRGPAHLGSQSVAIDS